MNKESFTGLTAIYRKVSEGYIGYVEEMPGINTQGSDLKEVKQNLKEAVILIIETNRQLAEKEIKGIDVIKEKISLDV